MRFFNFERFVNPARDAFPVVGWLFCIVTQRAKITAATETVSKKEFMLRKAQGFATYLSVLKQLTSTWYHDLTPFLYRGKKLVPN